jgi:hypothetical protein
VSFCEINFTIASNRRLFLTAMTVTQTTANDNIATTYGIGFGLEFGTKAISSATNKANYTGTIAAPVGVRYLAIAASALSRLCASW